MAKDKRKDPREYMLMAIETMKESKQEKRDDHPSPKVGAVLVFPDGKVEVAHRGELREGDHAEYTLLDKKHRHLPLDGCWLFATLEPCSPGSRNAPKVSCSERIVNARISKVWFGEEDFALDGEQAGANYIRDSFVEVESFDPDLVKIIKELNKDFDEWALRKRKGHIEDESKPPSILYQQVQNADIESLSDDALKLYLERSKLNLKFKSPEFYRELLDCDLLKKPKGAKALIPTGNAILLFGKSPRNKFPQAAVKAKVDYGNNQSSSASFDDALVLIPNQIEDWLNKVIPDSYDRTKFKSDKRPFFPSVVIREAVINAIVHRDYSDDGSKILLDITPDKIVIKSPGLPVLPNTLEKLKTFSATSYSRNKKLALIFNRMGYMEESEFGMDTFREMRKKYNLPLPIITYEDPHLIVTFPRNADAIRDISNNNAIAQLNDEELAGYDFVKARREISRKDYEEYFNFERKKASNQLKKMKNLGLITDNNKPVTSHDYRYIYNDGI